MGWSRRKDLSPFAALVDARAITTVRNIINTRILAGMHSIPTIHWGWALVGSRVSTLAHLPRFPHLAVVPRIPHLAWVTRLSWIAEVVIP